MSKKAKESKINLYYINQGQAKNNKKTSNKKEKTKQDKKREQRIRNNKQRKENEFDLETETVIKMTNKNKIKKEQENKKNINKKEKQKKRRNKRIKTFLKLFLLIGLITGGTIFALTSPIFNIKNIVILNNNQVPTDTIISLSTIKNDENIFKFYSKEVIKKIKENPYIENIKINRKLPNTVEIEVEERIPQYSVEYMGKYVTINTQGYILDISEESKKNPIILGSSTNQEEIKPGDRLQNEDLKALEEIIKIMDVAKEKGIDEKITSIDISNKNEYSIYIESENKRIFLGDSSNLSNKILYVMAIIEQEKGKAGDIFVNGDLNNKFQPYFREKV